MITDALLDSCCQELYMCRYELELELENISETRRMQCVQRHLVQSLPHKVAAGQQHLCNLHIAKSAHWYLSGTKKVLASMTGQPHV